MHRTDPGSGQSPFPWASPTGGWSSPPASELQAGDRRCPPNPRPYAALHPERRDATILGEFRGAEERRDPKRLLRGLGGGVASPQDQALGEGELEVAGRVLEVRVFFALIENRNKGGG